MVAISLYKGNLHRTPPPPLDNNNNTNHHHHHHQWLMPKRKISSKDFKTLIQRRSKALSRLNPDREYDYEITYHSDKQVPEPESSDEEVDQTPHSNGLKDQEECLVIPSDELVAREVAAAKAVLPESDLKDEGKKEEKVEDQSVPPKDDTLSDKEKRKKEIEEKLKVLNERKHKLVQVLKQILHAEEELRRRSNMQGITGRPCVSLQVDVTNDYGSMSRQVTPWPGSEGNCVGDVEGADADDISNQNLHSRNMTQMSSMSPSSDTLHRRGPFSMVPNSSRGALGVVSSSPSRFAPPPTPTGQQGSLPTVSVTGTNYVASSPSPAGSGGTSVFRDARLPSPWN